MHRSRSPHRLADHRCHRRWPAPLLQRIRYELRQSGHDRGHRHCRPAELYRREPEDHVPGAQAQQV